jgi:hypothetical protein
MDAVDTARALVGELSCPILSSFPKIAKGAVDRGAFRVVEPKMKTAQQEQVLQGRRKQLLY